MGQGEAPIEVPADSNEARENDLDLVKFFDGKLAAALDNILPEFKGLTEDELVDRCNPTATDWKLRKTFTDLVALARKTGEEHIPNVRIFEGTVTRQYWFTFVLTNPNKVAFISRPMVEHTDLYQAIHRLALNKIFQMVKNCDIDPKYLPQILKIAETAGNRVHGPVVQRMQIQSKNINIEANARDLPTGNESDDQAAIQDRIASLQQRLIDAPKDVTPKEGDE